MLTMSLPPKLINTDQESDFLMNTDKTIETPQSPRISVAPMMDWTTKDYRFFARLFNPNVILYTEMVTTGAILFGGANRHLDYNNEEHPIVLQLGGSNPKDLATCTKMAQDWGYDEVKFFSMVKNHARCILRLNSSLCCTFLVLKISSKSNIGFSYTLFFYVFNILND